MIVGLHLNLVNLVRLTLVRRTRFLLNRRQMMILRWWFPRSSMLIFAQSALRHLGGLLSYLVAMMPFVTTVSIRCDAAMRGTEFAQFAVAIL